MTEPALIPPANDNDALLKACPICDKPGVERFRPFCSQRCADLDLGRWLTGRYAIPVRDEEDEDGEAAYREDEG